MKKILLSLLTAFIGLTAMAQSTNTKTFTDELTVQINDQVSNPMQATIFADKAEDGTYTFSLIDFRLKDEQSDLGIGNIILKGVTVKEENGVKTFATKQDINITPGSTGQPNDWLGPLLGVVPIDMTGEMTEDKMHCVIDIDMSATLQQVIKVNFGKEIEVAPAHDYTFTDELTVQINDQVSNPMQATIFADKAEDGTYTFSLIDFRLKDEQSDLGIGNIILKGVTVKEENGVKTFATKQEINIAPGSTGQPSDWLGPLLGVVPIDMTGEMTEDKMHCVINIDMSATLKQVIKVNFGKEIEVAPTHDYTFTDELTVQINDQVSNPMQATIFADKAEDGTYTFSLIDFRLKDEQSDLGIGNIILKGVTVKEENGVKTFATKQDINITPGSTGQPSDWLGPLLGVVPIDMTGEMTEDKMYCVINIDMSATLKQVIKVNFGKTITGIENTVVNNGLVNVYNINGTIVRSQVNAADALNNLPRGMYIVNGKKYIK